MYVCTIHHFLTLINSAIFIFRSLLLYFYFFIAVSCLLTSIYLLKLFIYLSIYTAKYLIIYLIFTIYYLSTTNYINHPMSIYLSICLSIYLSVCLFVYLSVCLVGYLTVCLVGYLGYLPVVVVAREGEHCTGI